METDKVTLAVGEDHTWHVPPTRFFILRETNEPVYLELESLGTGTERAEDVEGGFKSFARAPDERIRRIYVRNTGTESQTIKIGYSSRDVGIDRLAASLTANGLVALVSKGPSSAVHSTATIPAAAAEILAANNDRDSVVIVPDVNCYLGPSTITNANTRLTLAGQVWKTSGTYAIHALGESGAGAADGTFVEEERF